MPDVGEKELRASRTSDRITREVLALPADGEFDSIAELVRRMMNCKAAVVSIVDHDRIFLRAHPGLEPDEIPLSDGLCASAVMQDEPWIVANAQIDPRTLSNPLVAGDLGLRFYAGIPLRLSEGANVGVLAVIDFEPRELSEGELDTLKLFAGVVVQMLEYHLVAYRLAPR